MKVSVTVSMSSSFCSVSNRFLNSSWNSIFCYSICAASTLGWPLGHQLFSFHLYDQIDVAHSHYVLTSNVDLADDCYICEDVWPVC